MPHYMYLLKSLKDKRHYIGYSEDVEKRLAYHNSGRQRSTKNRIPFELIYFEKFDNKTDALRREKEIKSFKGGNSFMNLLECGPA